MKIAQEEIFGPVLVVIPFKDDEDAQTHRDTLTDAQLKGTYYPLLGMTKETQNKLIEDHFLFKEGDR